jgi:hypothetical protein
MREDESPLPDEGFATPEIAAAWSAEIDRRIAEYDRGDLKAVDAKTALDVIRRELAKRRALRADRR